MGFYREKLTCLARKTTDYSQYFNLSSKLIAIGAACASCSKTQPLGANPITEAGFFLC